MAVIRLYLTAELIRARVLPPEETPPAVFAFRRAVAPVVERWARTFGRTLELGLLPVIVDVELAGVTLPPDPYADLDDARAADTARDGGTNYVKGSIHTDHRLLGDKADDREGA